MNIRRYKALLVVLLGIIMLVMGYSRTVQATTNSQIDFEVHPVSLTTQVNKNENFFDLALTPGSTQQIQVKVHNFSTDKTIVVQSSFKNAVTQTGGSIVFKDTLNGIVANRNKTLTKVVTLPKAGHRITLEPGESKLVTAMVKMPKDKTQGMIYGAWHFIEYGNQSKQKRSSLAGNYAYNIAVELRGKHYKIYPELKYRKTTPILRNGHPALGIKVDNMRAMILKKATIKAIVYKKGLFASKRIYQAASKDIAPNSRLTIPISWGYDTMRPGKYTVDVSIQGENLWNRLPMSWHYKRVFTVKKAATKGINAQAAKKPVNKWIYIASASGLLMLCSFWFVYKVIRFSK